jgi:uracil-DNA glycosylase family 4
MTVSVSSREVEFAQLCSETQACTRCPRLAAKKAVFGPLNGCLTPKVLFIGEAPGRKGADRTRRPFTGDQSAIKFDEFLAAAGLTRDEIFITNAVLCCPADERKNQTPLRSEMVNCSDFLRRTLDLLNPPVVATVGAIALKALCDLTGARVQLARDAGRIIRLPRFALVPLYHVSPRVLHTVRTYEQQRRDFLAVRRAVRLAAYGSAGHADGKATTAPAAARRRTGEQTRTRTLRRV